MVNKKYDIIVHGATGFTGKLICNYIYKHEESKSIKWAISGKNQKRLDIIAQKYKVDSFKANSFDKESLNLITKQAKLIISVVGPYGIYGKKLIESCLNNHCHYLDFHHTLHKPNYLLH